MPFVFTLLLLVSLIFFIIGILAPQKALFFLEGKKTRKKSLTIYGLISFASFIGVAVTAPKVDREINPSSKAEEIKAVEPTVDYTDNKYVNKWISNSEDIAELEDYIKDEISRNWVCKHQINSKEEKAYTDSTLSKFIKFKDPTIGFKKFNSNASKGSYRINKDVLTIKHQGSTTDFTTIEEEWKVIYNSKQLLILATELDLKIYLNSEKIEKAEEEIKYYLAYQKQKSIETLEKMLQSTGDVLKKENDIIRALTLSKGFLTIDSTFIPKSTLLSIKEYLETTSQDTDSALAKNYTSLFSKYPIPKKGYKVNTNYIQAYEDGKLDWVILLLNRSHSNLETSQLKKAIKIVEKKYNKMYKLYSIYGTGSNLDMAWVAESYMEKRSKNPSSFEFVEGYPTTTRTRKGWVYHIKYRGTNSYNAVVTSTKNLVLRYNTANRRYLVVGIM